MAKWTKLWSLRSEDNEQKSKPESPTPTPILTLTDPPCFSVLVADSYIARSNSYRLKGNPSRLCITRTWNEFSEKLKFPWNVVMIAGPVWGTPGTDHLTTTLDTLIEAFKQGRIEAVVVNASVENWGETLTKGLKAAGVPADWYPYNYLEPSKHVLREVKVWTH